VKRESPQTIATLLAFLLLLLQILALIYFFFVCHIGRRFALELRMMDRNVLGASGGGGGCGPAGLPLLGSSHAADGPGARDRDEFDPRPTDMALPTVTATTGARV